MALPVDRHLKLKGENKYKIIIIIIIIVALLTAPLRTDRPSGASKGDIGCGFQETCNGPSGAGSGFSPSSSVVTVISIPPMLHSRLRLRDGLSRRTNRSKECSVAKVTVFPRRRRKKKKSKF